MNSEEQQEELFLKVKQQIAMYFGVSAEGDDFIQKPIVADLNDCIRRRRRSLGEMPTLVIANEDIRGAINEVASFCGDDLEMYVEGKSYECLVQSTPFLSRDECFDKDVDDKLSGLLFNLGWASFEYCVFLLVTQAEGSSDFDIRRIVRSVLSPDIEGLDLDALDWRGCLPRLMGTLTLKIRTIRTDGEEKLGKSDFDIRANSFEFKYMYCRELPLRRVKTLEDGFSKRIRSSRPERLDVDSVPLRKYDEEAIDYYRLALLSSDPYLQYISYYHALEFYYPKALKAAVVKELKEGIEDVDFSFEDEALYRIAGKIKKAYGYRRENGSGGELQDLTYVLQDYVKDIRKLKNDIESCDNSLISYYAETDVPFTSEKNHINWNSENVWSKIANRVYATRNALIHSKDIDDAGRYNHFRDRVDLQKEIPLVKTLAKTVINNAGELLV